METFVIVILIVAFIGITIGVIKHFGGHKGLASFLINTKNNQADTIYSSKPLDQDPKTQQMFDDTAKAAYKQD